MPQEGIHIITCKNENQYGSKFLLRECSGKQFCTLIHLAIVEQIVLPVERGVGEYAADNITFRFADPYGLHIRIGGNNLFAYFEGIK